MKISKILYKEVLRAYKQN